MSSDSGNAQLCQSCRTSFDSTPGTSFLARHLCQSCGFPRAVLKEETYFQALDVPAKFLQDRSLLQKHFYEASRALHPDRFTASSGDAKRFSLERMSFLNEAYRVLKAPAELREYMLELYGMKTESGARAQIPMELAEGWFELQDALNEELEKALPKLEAFKQELEIFRRNLTAKMGEIEKNLDSLDPSGSEYREGLAGLSKSVQEQSYLNSLGRDVERIELRARK